jgi:hypothetical protein
MARGGIRDGSGRKPALAPQEAYDIIMDCERRLLRFVPEIDPCRPYAVARAAIDSLDVSERPAWLKSDGAEDRLDDVEFALREEQKVADVGQAASRLTTLKRPYAKGVRQVIAAEVAQRWSEILGRPISSKTVFRYWKAHRARPRNHFDLIVAQF